MRQGTTAMLIYEAIFDSNETILDSNVAIFDSDVTTLDRFVAILDSEVASQGVIFTFMQASEPILDSINNV
ncbi:hypothetical protein [Dyadobacter psychrotolerans]|jgi:hypothetical protein|uniref:Uncharacterized protein n=1 Tax=Dyadobacter psychrotolerans TaxID=2541721 RepID=A0A4R5DC29_9BACT|nr:hypothetical protein [Dyadobacter psychrotolerans]TDE09371.1 hypothetical protein E0F88_30585 [Dyadobacter psychrotolerans]